MNNEKNIIDVEYEDAENESYITAPQVAQKIKDSDTRVRHWAESYVFGDLIGIEKLNGRKRYKEADIYKFAFIKELADKNYTHEQIRTYISKNGFKYAEYDGGLVNPKDPLGFQVLASALTVEMGAKLDEFSKEIFSNFVNQLSEHLVTQQKMNSEMKAELESAVDEIMEAKLLNVMESQQLLFEQQMKGINLAVDNMEHEVSRKILEREEIVKVRMDERRKEKNEHTLKRKGFWQILFNKE